MASLGATLHHSPEFVNFAASLRLYHAGLTSPFFLEILASPGSPQRLIDGRKRHNGIFFSSPAQSGVDGLARLGNVTLSRDDGSSR